MIVKALSNQDFALIQQLCFDQWHLQKCHARLRALEVISHPPDLEMFQKLVDDLVSHFTSCSVFVFLNFSMVETSSSAVSLRKILRRHP